MTFFSKGLLGFFIILYSILSVGRSVWGSSIDNKNLPLDGQLFSYLIISQNYTTISAQNMTPLTQNYLKARYKATCLRQEVNIKETLFSGYPHVWWLRVGVGSQGNKR